MHHSSFCINGQANEEPVSKLNTYEEKQRDLLDYKMCSFGESMALLAHFSGRITMLQCKGSQTVGSHNQCR